MATLEHAVGPTTPKRPVKNLVGDQSLLIDLLGRIERSQGGQRGWAAPSAGLEGACQPGLAAAIQAFQTFWGAKAGLGLIDGVVRPNSKTFLKMWSLAFDETQDDVFTANGIEFRVKDQARFERTMQVIAPLSAGGMLFEMAITATVHCFLMQMSKDGQVYWVGACVPKDCWNFDALHVFFHPTVINGGVVHAADGDYPTFSGGWDGSLRRYIAMEGVQVAAARRQPMIVPFTTMAACSGRGPSNMFATRPMETLNAIASAIAWHDDPLGERDVKLKRVGTASFSSGIGAHQLFVKALGSEGVIVESTDLDSGYITASLRLLTKAPGGAGRAFCQNPPFHPQPGWLHVSASRFAALGTYKNDTHAQIGWMGYYMMLLSSVV